MTKPRVWIFLLITGIAGLFFAISLIRSINLLDLLYIIVYLTFGLMGSESLANYVDRDIDKKMSRTKDRPLPSGKLKPHTALTGGLLLTVASLVMSYYQSTFSFLFMATGIFDYVVIYAYLFKRRTWLNIILGAYSGGAPLLAGFTSIDEHLNVIIIMWFAIIIIWTPLHIWALSIKYRDDYKNAGIPMLPVVVPIERTTKVLLSAAIGTAFLTTLSGVLSLNFFKFNLGWLDLGLSILMSAFIIFAYINASRDPEKKIMSLFVMTNIFIGMFFVMVSIISLISLIV